ncbi:MAG: hypothetical protein WC785_01890 [Tatlockia sp.]|jgi:hypothetical protein
MQLDEAKQKLKTYSGLIASIRTLFILPHHLRLAYRLPWPEQFMEAPEQYEQEIIAFGKKQLKLGADYFGLAWENEHSQRTELASLVSHFKHQAEETNKEYKKILEDLHWKKWGNTDFPVQGTPTYYIEQITKKPAQLFITREQVNTLFSDSQNKQKIKRTRQVEIEESGLEAISIRETYDLFTAAKNQGLAAFETRFTRDKQVFLIDEQINTLYWEYEGFHTQAKRIIEWFSESRKDEHIKFHANDLSILNVYLTRATEEFIFLSREMACRKQQIMERIDSLSKDNPAEVAAFPAHLSDFFKAIFRFKNSSPSLQQEIKNLFTRVITELHALGGFNNEQQTSAFQQQVLLHLREKTPCSEKSIEDFIKTFSPPSIVSNAPYIIKLRKIKNLYSDGLEQLLKQAQLEEQSEALSAFFKEEFAKTSDSLKNIKLQMEYHKDLFNESYPIRLATENVLKNEYIAYFDEFYDLKHDYSHVTETLQKQKISIELLEKIIFVQQKNKNKLESFCKEYTEKFIAPAKERIAALRCEYKKQRAPLIKELSDEIAQTRPALTIKNSEKDADKLLLPQTTKRAALEQLEPGIHSIDALIAAGKAKSLPYIKGQVEPEVAVLKAQVQQVRNELISTNKNAIDNILSKSTIVPPQLAKENPFIEELTEKKGLFDQTATRAKDKFNKFTSAETKDLQAVLDDFNLITKEASTAFSTFQEVQAKSLLIEQRLKSVAYKTSLTVINTLAQEYQRILGNAQTNAQRDNNSKLLAHLADIGTVHLDLTHLESKTVALNAIDSRLARLLAMKKDFEAINAQYITKDINLINKNSPCATSGESYRLKLAQCAESYLDPDQMENWSTHERNRFLQFIRRMVCKPFQKLKHAFSDDRLPFFVTKGATQTEKAMVNLGNDVYKTLGASAG